MAYNLWAVELKFEPNFMASRMLAARVSVTDNFVNSTSSL